MNKKRKPDAKPSASGFVSERKKEGADAELLPRTAEAKRSEFLLTCDGCQFLHFEDRPHGVKAARCGNPEAGSGTIRGFGRTLEIFATGEIGPVVRPAWCTNERKRIATPARGAGSQ